MRIDEINPPVIVFSPDYKTFEFAWNVRELSVTNKLGLKKGVILNNIIIDGSGKSYKTIKATKKGNYYPFWKFEFFNPLIYIELEVERLEDEFDLADLKKRVIKAFKHEGGPKIVKLIGEARTHKELITLIGKHVDFFGKSVGCE